MIISLLLVRFYLQILFHLMYSLIKSWESKNEGRFSFRLFLYYTTLGCFFPLVAITHFGKTASFPIQCRTTSFFLRFFNTACVQTQKKVKCFTKYDFWHSKLLIFLEIGPGQLTRFYFIRYYEAGLYKPTVLKFRPPIWGILTAHACNNTGLTFHNVCFHALDPNEWYMKNVL